MVGVGWREDDGKGMKKWGEQRLTNTSPQEGSLS